MTAFWVSFQTNVTGAELDNKQCLWVTPLDEVNDASPLQVPIHVSQQYCLDATCSMPAYALHPRDQSLVVVQARYQADIKHLELEYRDYAMYDVLNNMAWPRPVVTDAFAWSTDAPNGTVRVEIGVTKTGVLVAGVRIGDSACAVFTLDLQAKDTAWTAVVHPTNNISHILRNGLCIGVPRQHQFAGHDETDVFIVSGAFSDRLQQILSVGHHERLFVNDSNDALIPGSVLAVSNVSEYARVVYHYVPLHDSLAGLNLIDPHTQHDILGGECRGTVIQFVDATHALFACDNGRFVIRNMNQSTHPVVAEATIRGVVGELQVSSQGSQLPVWACKTPGYTIKAVAGQTLYTVKDGMAHTTAVHTGTRGFADTDGRATAATQAIDRDVSAKLVNALESLAAQGKIHVNPASLDATRLAGMITAARTAHRGEERGSAVIIY